MLCLLWVVLVGGPGAAASDDLLVASGAADQGSAVIWASAPGADVVTIQAGTRPGQARWTLGPIATDPSRGHTAQVRLDGLPPGKEIHYSVRAGEQQASGRLHTLPRPGARRAVRLAVVGDLAGHRACRPAEGAWAILDIIAGLEPDLLVANGDMIYADYPCTDLDEQGGARLAAGFAEVDQLDWTDADGLRRAFVAHWRYGREDPAHRRLLAAVPMVAQWDDHEVINDFGAAWERYEVGDRDRPGYPTLVAEGLAAFRAWNPVDGEPLYRSLRVGRHVELFVVDGRSYRSPNPEPDGPDKTMLGPEQRDWLVQGLLASTATWKVVSMNVPLSAPSGSRAWRNGRDSWANGTGEPETPPGEADISATTGFERELGQILDAVSQVEGLVFVVTDAHYAQSIRYERGHQVFWELISGPLSARHYQPVPLDDSFGPQSLYAEGGFDNFGLLEVTRRGDLRWVVVDAAGAERPGSELWLDRP